MPKRKSVSICNWRRTDGQALVEFAVVVPMLFLLIAFTMNFGTWVSAWIDVANATRAAADYAILGDGSAGNPVLATYGSSGTLAGLVNTDLESLPNLNSSNPQVCIQESNGTKFLELPTGACGANGACGSSACAAPTDSEPEFPGSATDYPNVAVDITYTYTSFFSGNRILGLPLTVLPSSIHRRTVMRLLIL